MTIHGTNLEAITDTLQLQLLEEGNNKLVVFSPITRENIQGYKTLKRPTIRAVGSLVGAICVWPHMCVPSAG